MDDLKEPKILQEQDIPIIDQPEIERKISKAKSLLILDHPFFGTAVTCCPIIYTDVVPTASMTMMGQLRINPTFVAPLSVKNLQFLLAHEAMHYMLSHVLRRKHREPKAWNVACDKVINDMLIDAGVGVFIEGGVTMANARNYAVEELYDEKDSCGGEGPGGTGNDIGDPVDENGNPLEKSQVHALEAQAKIQVAQSAKAAKALGKLPGSIQCILDEIVSDKTPWHEILQRFMTSKIKEGCSWQRPNRRFMGVGLYLPGADYRPRLGHVVIGIDTSGSICQQELNEFAGHVNGILDLCGPEKVTVVYCDFEVNHVDEYTPEDLPINLSSPGGGRTSFKPVFDYIDTHFLEPEIVVYLTDGYGDQDCFTSHHETVWVTTEREEFSWGDVVAYRTIKK